jgi:deoxyribonuclease-4
MSVAGGLHEGARRLGEVGAHALQVFTKNSNQWAAKPVTEEQIEQFRSACRRYAVKYCVSHDSYLINLAATGELGKKSYAAFVDEIRRCDQYGIGDVVFHPGAHVGAGVDTGLKRVAKQLLRALDATSNCDVRLLIEITAGQGSSLCARFEEVRDLIASCGGLSKRLAVCFDTCHAHAAGYDLSSAEAAVGSFDEFDRIVGCASIALFHVNDAKKPCGSRADRHEHIGRGTIGLAAFRMLGTDPRFSSVPRVLETEKGINPATGRDYDIENLETLRSLGWK